MSAKMVGCPALVMEPGGSKHMELIEPWNDLRNYLTKESASFE